MMDYKAETEKRVQFLRDEMKKAGARGLIFGNSGGKDSALVGILCKMATDNTLAVAMPCHSSRNYESDMDDAKRLCDAFGIEMVTADLSSARDAVIGACPGDKTDAALSNIAPRLRMTALYLMAQSRGYLVVGTGNRSEIYMGYFTKWGDGGYDVNPIGDIPATEVFGFLRFLGAPLSIIEKAPSAGLFEGQTDEGDMGVTYAQIDSFMDGGETGRESAERIIRYHRNSEHKRNMPHIYKKEI